MLTSDTKNYKKKIKKFGGRSYDKQNMIRIQLISLHLFQILKYVQKIVWASNVTDKIAVFKWRF